MNDSDFKVVNIIKRIPEKDGYRNSLDETVLGEILLHPDVSGIPVALYSIAGPFRSGKSFFLNLFVKFLRKNFLQEKDAAHEHKDRDSEDDHTCDEMGNDDEHDDVDGERKDSEDDVCDSGENLVKIRCDSGEETTGGGKTRDDEACHKRPDDEENELFIDNVFSWKGGFERHTEGILILKKPFIVSSEEHPRVALFLLDTQGMFDHKEATQNSARIGALSFLISSIQLFNIMMQLDGNHLQYIYRFAKFAKDIKEHDGGDSPFQSLMFLVRDWKKKKFRHGFDGGKQYIDHVMQTSSSQAQEHQCVRDDLYQTFDDIACYLLPPPGDEVEDAEESSQQFPVEDVHPSFFEKANKLFEHICSSPHLVVKRFHEKVVSGRELFHYITAYSAVMNGELDENVQSFLLAGFKAKMKNITTNCSVHYRKNMSQKACMEWKTEDWHKLEEVHINLKNEALSLFDEETKPGNTEFVEKWRLDLETIVDSSFNEIKELVTTILKEAIEDYHKSLTSGLQLKGKDELDILEKETRKRLSLSLKHQLDPDISEVFSEVFFAEAAVIFTEVRDLNVKNRQIAGTVAGAAAGAVAIGATLLLPPVAAAAMALKLSSPVVVGTGAAVWGKVGNMVATTIDKEKGTNDGEKETNDEEKETNNGDESLSSNLEKYPALQKYYVQSMSNREPLALQENSSTSSMTSQPETSLSASKNVCLAESDGNEQGEEKLHTSSEKSVANLQEEESSIQSFFSSFKSFIDKGVAYLDENIAMDESELKQTTSNCESESLSENRSENPTSSVQEPDCAAFELRLSQNDAQQRVETTATQTDSDLTEEKPSLE